MKMRTYVETPKLLEIISREDKICSIGSCFSDEIARLLQKEGYDILINPFGVQYNPVSISNALHFLSDPSFYFTKDDVIRRDPYYGRKKNIAPGAMPTAAGHRPIAPCAGGYTSFYHHGSFSRSTPEEFLQDANSSLDQARKHFLGSSVVIITFGTDLIYRHIEKGIVVSNCHKHLARDFRREEAGREEIIRTYSEILQNHSEKKWIFTVSPIRYTKDGLHVSQLSKARLLLVIDELVHQFQNALYFPSYEIVLDELRDYSYYKEDMVHPNEDAIRYIFNKITQP